ncbi:glycosyltransferase [uncultured Helicobacter sp.]|uniref:glycosyltransferase n=1 Tax=uncultured Helicobacter sp. TaxID=175537 RepID=UPI003753675D
MKKAKILLLGKFYPPTIGGIETTMQDICEGLNASGFVCDVLCSHTRWHFGYEIAQSGARIYRTKSYGKLASTSITPQMIFTLRRLAQGYDIIHLHLPDPMANLALMCANLRDKKIILHWHSDIIKQKHLLKLYMPLQSWLLRRANLIIGTSPKYLEQSPFLQAYKHKCVAIPSGVQLPAQITPPPKRNLTQLFALGRLVPYKGFEYAIKMMQHLPKEYRLCIGGKGELESSLKQLVASLKLQDSVEFLGFIADESLPRFYQECGIFIFSSISKNEAFGLVQVEAMSYGMPVVSCAIEGSGVDWVNEHGYSGIVVPPKDPRALARAVEQIAKDYARFSQNAKARYYEHFTKEKMIDSLKDLYTRLLMGGGAALKSLSRTTPRGRLCRAYSLSYVSCVPLSSYGRAV